MRQRLIRSARRSVVVSLIAAGLMSATSTFAAATPADNAFAPSDPIRPPWQGGKNNDATAHGLEFTVPEVDVLADFHGDLTDPKLVLFVGGNYFFAMAPLVEQFEALHPEFLGHIYWETIPPGLLVNQMKAGGKITVGNMSWTAKPDAYFAGLNKVRSLIADGTLVGPAVPYVSNQLTILVQKGNPKHIRGLADLARADVRLAMPNPAFEGVARQIKAALDTQGGTALVNTVYGRKVALGTTTLTQIHHRQTALFLMQDRADAGVLWQSEARFQEMAGHPVSHVDFAQSSRAIYAGALVKGAKHVGAARTWLDYLTTAPALAIFARYGFTPVNADHATASH